MLGSTGMAGHVVAHHLQTLSAYEVLTASRSHGDLFFDACDHQSVERLLRAVKPDCVINCVGVLVQTSNQDPVLAVQVNSLLPHLLATHGLDLGFRLIHISTDCVFSGQHGPYIESDPTDAWDHYGKSKALGEVVDSKNLTIRTSIIGPEVRDPKTGLFEWFMAQEGVVKGFTRAIWSGVTTLELAKFIAFALETPDLTGLVHLSNDVGTSKYELLSLIQKIWQKQNVSIEPCGKKRVNKSFVSSRDDMSYVVPNYDTMLIELKELTIPPMVRD